MSPAERTALSLLDTSMGTSSYRIGLAILPDACGAIYRGAAILGRLHRKGFVARLGRRGLWRITTEGRDALTPRKDSTP